MLSSRQGRGDMAVSNALGSNVQNVFFVLAAPIFVSVLVRGSYTSDSAEILSSVLWSLDCRQKNQGEAETT